MLHPPSGELTPYRGNYSPYWGKLFNLLMFSKGSLQRISEGRWHCVCLFVLYWCIYQGAHAVNTCCTLNSPARQPVFIREMSGSTEAFQHLKVRGGLWLIGLGHCACDWKFTSNTVTCHHQVLEQGSQMPNYSGTDWPCLLNHMVLWIEASTKWMNVKSRCKHKGFHRNIFLKQMSAELRSLKKALSFS